MQPSSNGFEDFCAHPLGCDPSIGRDFPLRLFLWDVLCLPANPTVTHARSRLHLFGEHFMEYQRDLAQLHPQSLVPVAVAQPLVQHS
jgi:hypothetical protein